ncbi:MAG: selenide, water dikinase SelD, partial [Acetobacteraceae bacterium]|nr:selenide, water dikinase SelD [Acetobacteraceae bacterium]
SGMLPGLIRGEYGFDESHIDLAPLTAAARARLIMAEAAGIDPVGRRVSVCGRPDLPYDLLSIDVGGVPAMPPCGGIPVKPIGQFLERLTAVEQNSTGRLAVVGAGPAGTELALALSHRLRASAPGRRTPITLISAESEPLPEAPTRARAIARAALAEMGIELVCGVRAGPLREGKVPLSDGSYLETGAALWATHVKGPAFLAASGIGCDEAGCVRVDPCLRSLSHPSVFAAGDCAAIEGAPRPKAGVWAVRAGRPLAANLRRAARGRPLRPWKPQSEALVILGLGNGRAVAWRNGITLAGRLIWRWKDHIDRRWMRMYQQIQSRMPPMDEDSMRCGGCGAKVGSAVLAQALASVTSHRSAGLLIGLDAPDDAAAALPPPGMAVVQSVDHFRAFLDDPYVFGQIAAAHALSDLHAMGASPWTALAVAGVPYSTGAKMGADLSAMLQGATEVLNQDGCALVGGHSGEAAEPALGFAVTGLAEPRRLWRKSGLKPGHLLIVTKALGTGIVLAGQMRGLAKARWLKATIASMVQTNAAAARILRDFGVTACTDITGFGLMGHLLEMIQASDVCACLDPARVPVLPGARALAARGISSSLAPENARLWTGVDPLLVDPQTSGGLLAGLAPDSASACVAELRAEGYEAALIGVVQPKEENQPAIKCAQLTLPGTRETVPGRATERA